LEIRGLRRLLIGVSQRDPAAPPTRFKWRCDRAEGYPLGFAFYCLKIRYMSMIAAVLPIRAAK
jgi:hypothetical protein